MKCKKSAPTLMLVFGAGVTLTTTVQAQSDAPAEATLQEVVVTAQKFVQDVQKVALAVEVLNGPELENRGVVNLYALDHEAAGLHIFDVGPSVNIMIRGVGNQSALSASDPTAAFNVDGVYRARASSLNGVMYDLARVEVVKGPMGTLYGRNATTGAVNLISNAPTQSQEASATVEVGNFDLFRAQGMVNTPLADDLAFRAAFGLLRHRGYDTDGYGDADQIGGRARLLYKPIDALSLLVTGDYARQGGYGQGNVIQHPAALGEAANPLYTVPAGATDWYGNEAPGNLNNADWGVTAEMSYDLGWANLVVQPAHRNSSSFNRGYTSGARAGIVNDFTSHQDSAEVRLNSLGESTLRWVVGTYYYKDHLDNPSALTSTFVSPTNASQIPTPDRHRSYTDAILDTNAYAGFGQVTVPIVERFRVVAGGRYTSEKRTLSGSGFQLDYNSLAPDILYPIPALNYPLSARNDSHHTDWKGGIELDVTDTSMFYATASTGFKAGGLNPVNTSSTGPTQSPAAFDPEELLEYTAGIKNRLFDNRLSFNLSYFHWDYKHRQIINAGPVGGGLVTSNLTGSAAALANPAVCFAPPVGIACNFTNITSGKQQIQGVDLDGALAITGADTLSWSLEWLHSKYADDPLNAGVPAGGANLALGAVDLRGKRLSFSPDYSLNLEYTHNFRMDNGAVVSFIGGVQWVSDQDVNNNLGQSQNPATAFQNPIGAKASLQPSYWLGDTTLMYTTPNEHFSTSLWVRNIGNEAIKASASQAINPGIGAPPVAPFNNSVWLSTVRPPRTFGMSFSAKF